jgi:hypothetical protein
VLAGLGHGDGALWVGVGETTPVGNVQRAKGKERGVWAVLLLVLLVSRPGSGQGRLGSTAGDSTSMATGLGRTGTAMATVESISWIFAHQVLDIMPARIETSNF